MRYIFKYEGFILNLLGKLFNDLLSGIDDKEYKDKANTVISIIEKIKNVKELPNIFIKIQKELENDIKDINSLGGAYEFIKKDITMINIFLSTSAKKLDSDRLKPNILYKESSNKILQEIFLVKKTFKNDKEYQAAFKNNVDNSIKNFIKIIAKKCGYSEEDISKSLETDEKTQGQAQGQAQEQKQGQAQEQKQGQVQTKSENKNEKDPKINKLKIEITKFHKSIFEPLNKKIQEVVKSGNQNTIDNFAKTFKSTKNTETVKKIITKLAQLDKDKLIKIREIQGLTKDDAPL